MTNFTTLFRLLQLTRAQVQYGYVLAEIPKANLSDLAQHHYLVTMNAWCLGRHLKQQGIAIDTEKLLEISLIHDLGELFGGDISMPYAMANPAARTLAKEFEAENHRYIARFFGDQSEYFAELTEHARQPQTLEAVVAKIADYVEVTHYKLYIHCLTPGDVTMVTKQLITMCQKLEDTAAGTLLEQFIAEWSASLADGKLPEIFEGSK
jgi:5'-deoxynucleotidase YfbR-like HD superfamily hydrolase